MVTQVVSQSSHHDVLTRVLYEAHGFDFPLSRSRGVACRVCVCVCVPSSSLFPVGVNLTSRRQRQLLTNTTKKNLFLLIEKKQTKTPDGLQRLIMSPLE